MEGFSLPNKVKIIEHVKIGKKEYVRCSDGIDRFKSIPWPFDHLSLNEQLDMWPKYLVRKKYFHNEEDASVFCISAILNNIQDIDHENLELQPLVPIQKICKEMYKNN